MSRTRAQRGTKRLLDDSESLDLPKPSKNAQKEQKIENLKKKLKYTGEELNQKRLKIAQQDLEMRAKDLKIEEQVEIIRKQKSNLKELWEKSARDDKELQVSRTKIFELEQEIKRLKANPDEIATKTEEKKPYSPGYFPKYSKIRSTGNFTASKKITKELFCSPKK